MLSVKINKANNIFISPRRPRPPYNEAVRKVNRVLDIIILCLTSVKLQRQTNIVFKSQSFVE